MKSPAARTRTTEPLLHGTVLERQYKLEEDAIREGVLRYRRLAKQAIERNEGASLKPAERLVFHWTGPLEAALASEQRAIRAGQPEVGRAINGPFLMMLTPTHGAVLCLRELVSRLMDNSGGIIMPSIAHSIGRAWASEINIQLLRRKRMQYQSKQTGQVFKVNAIDLLKNRIRRVTPSRVNWWARKHLDDPINSKRTFVHIGMRLLALILENCSVPDDKGNPVPAFRHDVRNVGRLKKGFIAMSWDTARLIEAGHAARQFLRPRYLPMLTNPMPWEVGCEGGYLQTRTPLISKPSREQKFAIDSADMTDLYTHLNIVAGTEHSIMAKTLDVAEAFWKDGKGGPGIPHMEEIPKPPMPPEFNPNAEKGHRWDGVDKAIRSKWRAEAIDTYKQNMQLRSARVETIQKLQVARMFKSEPVMYFPKMIDFRSRAYSLPQPLNFEGNDFCRGLIQFAKPREVNDRAVYWLMVHAANMYGIDKVSHNDRMQWVDDHWEDIERCAKDPLTCEFWHHADGGDKPWQFLAACFALTDPYETGARLIRQTDGTINGLQHYAAMTRDERGAAAANLINGPAPVDTYLVVTNVVRDMVNDDIRRAIRVASLVAPHVNRSSCKPGTMTEFYGVTNFGRNNQTFDYLKKHGMDRADLRESSQYLAAKVKGAVSNICPRATETMVWLQKCAAEHVKNGRPFAYTTPLGFPMVQSYRDFKSLQLKTCLQYVSIAVDDMNSPLDAERHCTAAPPNFIHSLDATAMFMTAKACNDSGIAFVGVHDMFGTHAADADELDRHTREQFVQLYRRPVLQDAYEQFQRACPNGEFPEPPAQGTFDLDQVLTSRYFFN